MSIYDQPAAETQTNEDLTADRSRFKRPVRGRSNQNADSSSYLVLLPPYTDADSSALLQEDDDVIEGQYVETQDVPVVQQDSISPAATWPSLKRKRGPILLVLLIAILVALVISTPLALSALTPTATVTVVPLKQDVRGTQHIQAVTGSPDGTAVHARIVSETSTSNTLKVNTTGSQATPAETARGMITLSNNAPYPQTIVPGPATVMIGSDGVQIQLDSVVTVPKGSPPNSNGVIRVAAHAIQPGASGNIVSGDINAPCCASNIVALNESGFSGGKDAQPYHVVAQGDIDGAVGTLKGPLSQRVQASITAGLHSGEQLGVITSCSQQPQADPVVATRADSVSVTLTMTCTGIAYNQDSAKQRVTARAESDAAKQLGVHYALLSGSMHVSFEPAAPVPGNSNALALTAHTEGFWIYKLDTRAVGRLLAGKNLQDAQDILSRMQGIDHSSLHIAVPFPTPWWNNSTMPVDPHRIYVTTLSS